MRNATNARVKWARLALAGALSLGCLAGSAATALAQDTASSAVRKVKTRVVPEYPKIASQLNLQGKVRIQAEISADGHVTNTKVIGGHPVLAGAAVDAVKKWVFETGPKETTEVIEITFAGRQ